jgi:hypothetical protein
MTRCSSEWGRKENNPEKEVSQISFPTGSADPGFVGVLLGPRVCEGERWLPLQGSEPWQHRVQESTGSRGLCHGPGVRRASETEQGEG